MLVLLILNLEILTFLKLGPILVASAPCQFTKNKLTFPSSRYIYFGVKVKLILDMQVRNSLTHPTILHKIVIFPSSEVLFKEPLDYLLKN